MQTEHGVLLEDGNIAKVVVCPHTGKEVVGWYQPGNTDGFPDYLCLHNDDDELDAEDVAYFKLHNKIKPRP